MPVPKKTFKKPPQKHQPRGLTIIYEDHDLIVVDKVAGLLSVGTEKVKDNTAYSHLLDYVKKGNPKSKAEVHIVHRLDRDTSGVLVFSKSRQAKGFLQDHWQDFSKTYYAVVHGSLFKKQGEIITILAENSAHKVYSINDPEQGKLSKTAYKVIKESKNFSLVEIDLITGRKNQIRAHMSEMGHPIAGDRVYGDKARAAKRLMLHAASMTLVHPHSKEKMTFEAKIPDYFKSLVSGKIKPLDHKKEEDTKAATKSSISKSNKPKNTKKTS
ncbi:MAG: RluA family pseudouridine synthase [SAR324 cluster bacterium]|nr:RluA family pseudouridine synthase [SAR324 cluster bacterium]